MPHAGLRYQLSVSELDFYGLRRTGGGSRWDDGTVKTGLSDNINLDGWVTARVVDLASVDLCDRHYGVV